MKYVTLLALLSILVLDSQAQEFIVDPQNDLIQFEKDNVVYQQTQITDGTDQSSPIQTFYVNNEGGVFEIAKIGYNESSISGKLEVFRKYGAPGILMDGQEFKFYDGNDPKIRITSGSGYEHYENGILRFKIDGGAIQGYKSDGTRTIKISTSFGGDGRITTDELELTGGSDLSEHFDLENSKDQIAPGLLVSIANAQGKLAITNTKRDKKVVGVISGANGIETGLLMGQKGSIADGDYPVALTGRTYVYANTENGSIDAGDFLTSSSTPGYAMKVKKIKRTQGAIIGKAMTELTAGEGFVLVLVNLQ